ncbi:MAG: hypothetical protein RL240_1729 [Planctomycetota bacterium]
MLRELLKMDHKINHKANMISKCLRAISSRCLAPRLTLFLCSICFALCSIASEGNAQSVFVLKIPDGQYSSVSQNQSVASISDEQLVVQDTAGGVTTYTRLRRYDTPDGQFIAYASREAQRVIQWPVANRGAMRIGTLQNGRIEFSQSRMSVFSADSDVGQGLGNRSPNEQPMVFDEGQVSSPAGYPSMLLATGEPNSRSFLRANWSQGGAVASGGGVQFVSQANDPQAAWMITPVGGDMVRVQQAVGNQWAALGVDPRDIQGFGNGVLAQRGARAQIRFSAVNNSVSQLWRIEQQFGGGYCFESVAMPGFGMTCIPNQGLWLQPLVYSPWQIWWAQQPSFNVSMPQYRIANEQIVPNPPLGPISLRVANTHSEAIVVLLADRRNPNAPRKLRIPAGGSEVLVLERDSGATINQTTEFVDGFGNWDRREYQIPVPPVVLYDVSVYEEFLQSIAIDRTGKSPNVIEDINYQPRSVGFLLLPPGDQLQDNSVLDVYRAAADSKNPGAVRKLSPSDYNNSSSSKPSSAVPSSDPLNDLLKQLQGKRGAF